MDFDEFAVVLKHLNASNRAITNEITKGLISFKNTTKPGQRQKLDFKSQSGYMLLEREDPQAFSIYIFTDKNANQELESAYEAACDELGI